MRIPHNQWLEECHFIARCRFMTSDVGGFAKQNVGDSEGVFFSIWGWAAYLSYVAQRAGAFVLVWMGNWRIGGEIFGY